MTHDELLAMINPMTSDDAIFMKDALRAVVEYHKPYESKDYGLLCRGCDEDPNYPCGTIRVIEKELQ
jgi:hypothetical protein